VRTAVAATRLILNYLCAAAPFLGLPPRRPFFREAELLAVLFDLPPSAPSRAAIQRLEPKTPSSKAGR